jgi:hypothetical protein
MDSSITTEEKTIVDGHEYVDLGLPDGALWATCNIGANSPEEFGDYFAWGETQPKDSYGTASYKYCKDRMDSLTKYCKDSYYGHWGFTDKLAELLPEDDAATANWGSRWKMPTIGNCLVLVDSEFTTTEWTTLHGVPGRKITSNSNGRSIFLPAAGYRHGTCLDGVGRHGSYWSSMLPFDLLPCSNEARMLRISPAPTDYDMSVWKNCAREYGLSIRPVCFRDLV